MKHFKQFLAAVFIIGTLAFLASCGCSVFPPPSPVESTPSTTQTPTLSNHTHTEVVDAAIAPTCTATGLTEGKHCSVCNAVLVAQETVLATGHKAEVIPAVPATCTATGLSEGSKCSVCNEVLTAQVEVPAMGHTEEVIPAVVATCLETGLTEGKRCSVCGEILVVQAEVEKLAHTEVVDEAVPATLDSTGLTAGKHCSVCNTVLVPQETIPKLTPPPPTVKYPYAELVSRTTDGEWTTVRYNIWESKTKCRTFAYKFLNEGIAATYITNTGMQASSILVPMMVLEDSEQGCGIEHYKSGNYVNTYEQRTVFYKTEAGGYNAPGEYMKGGSPYGILIGMMPNVGETETFDVKLILFESELDLRLNLVRTIDLWETITVKRYPCDTYSDWVSLATPFMEQYGIL